MSKKIKLSFSVVLPAWNEQDNLPDVITSIVQYFKKRRIKYEIIIVDDGSTDDTIKIVNKINKKNKFIRLARHKVNRGYGAALTTGFRASKNNFIFYTDADNQFNIKDLDKLIPFIEKFDIVAGYRIARQDPLMRIFIAYVYNIIIRFSLGLKVRDVDCSFKVYNAKIFKKIKLTSITGLIDAEVLIKAKKRGFTIHQVGVRHFPRLKGQTIYEIGKRNKIFAFVRPQVIVELLKEISLLRAELK